MINTGLPNRVNYTAYNTTNNEFVPADSANHTLELFLNGVSLGAPTNPIKSIGDGVYEITLTDEERNGLDLVVKGASSTPDVIIVPVQYATDVRWNEILEDDTSGNLRFTGKAIEQSPIAEVSLLALETSVQDVLTTGGPGPWATAVVDLSPLALESSVQLVLDTGGPGPWTTAVVDLTGLALESSVQLVLDTGGPGPWTTADISGTEDVNVISWQGVELTGINMVEDAAGSPKWSRRALENGPAGSGSVTYVNLPTENRSGFLELLRGDTLDYHVTLNVSVAFVDEIWYTIKRSVNDLDSEALLQISSVQGLVVINGQPAVNPLDGSVVIESEESGVLRIRCIAARMAELPTISRNASMDIQISSIGNIFTVVTQNVSVVGDVTRAV